MPRVLTTNALIVCPHLGQGTSFPTDLKWVVNGGAVLLDGDHGVVKGCIFVLPCSGYELHSMRLNATQVDGRQTMLVTDFTQSITGFPLTIKEIHDTFDNSTPAPIPAGAAAPPTPPELQEIDQPTVTVEPGFFTFSTGRFDDKKEPASLKVTFLLQSQFPRRWLLTMLIVPKSDPLRATSQEITNDPPHGVVVRPAGGTWSRPALSVTVELEGKFMRWSLPLGDHYFVLTAVNFRGKSTFAQMMLTVSL
jgi:hypothetical protein